MGREIMFSKIDTGSSSFVSGKRCLVFLGILLVMFPLAAEKLNMFVDVVRTLQENGDTRYQVIYQVPYRELLFIKAHTGFAEDQDQREIPMFKAELKTAIEFYREGKPIHNKEFINVIATREQRRTLSARDYFHDLIEFTLTRPDMKVSVLFQDQFGRDSLRWEYQAEPLPSDKMVSDLELSVGVYPDSSFFMEKFHRNGLIYEVTASHVIHQVQSSHLYLYYEMYNRDDDRDIVRTLTVFQDDQVIWEETGTRSVSQVETFTDSIPIGSFTEGYYRVRVDVTGSPGRDSSEEYFIIQPMSSKVVRMFPDNESEYKLLGYFMDSRQKRIWKGLNEKARNYFIQDFWVSLDPNPATEQNEFLEMIRERIEYADNAFTFFKDGWKSDRGRIYLKQGTPDEIHQDTVTGSAPLQGGEAPRMGLLGSRDYEIWKYYMGRERKVYLFFDIHMNGDLILIYNINDNTEPIHPNWERYLGSDFDESEFE